MFRKTVLIAVLGLTSLLLAASAPINHIPISISNVINVPNHYDEVHSAIAYNSGFMRSYIVVWQQNDADDTNTSIYYRYMDFTGQLSTEVNLLSPIHSGVNLEPDVTYNPDNDQFLVVYSRDHAGIYAQVMSNAGVKIGSELTVVAGPAGDTYSSPAVAYSTGSGCYLVTWVYARGGLQGIQAGTITSGGVVSSDYLPVTELIASDPSEPDVAWSQLNNQFLIVWNKTATGSSDLDVYGQRISMSNPPSLAGSLITIFYSFDSEAYPAVTSIARTNGIGQYLVACQSHNSSNYFVDGQLVSQSGELEGSRIFISMSTGRVPAVAGNSTSQEYLAAWPYDAGSLHARTISTSGNPGSEKSLALGDNSLTAVAAGNGGDFLIVASGWLQAGYPYDVFGFLWGNRLFLPFLKR